MKKETELALSQVLQSGNLTYLDIDRLFDIYTTTEIKTLDDLYTGHREFFTFIQDNIDKFVTDEEFNKELIISLAYDKLKCFKLISNKFFRTYRMNQEQFAKEIEELVGYDKSVKILEIGSGELPYSSILLGSDGYNISSMDNFYVSEECLSHFNVKSFRQLFNAKTSVKNYDIVVGRRPCSAIENIVANCKRDNVPYFMRLCGCNAPGGNVSGWRRILSSLDKNIKYSGSYAYNLDGTVYNKPFSLEQLILMDSDRSYT